MQKDRQGQKSYLSFSLLTWHPRQKQLHLGPRNLLHHALILVSPNTLLSTPVKGNGDLRLDKMVRKALFRTIALGEKELSSLRIQQGKWEFIDRKKHEEVSDGKFLRGDVKVGWFCATDLTGFLLKVDQGDQVSKVRDSF